MCLNDCFSSDAYRRQALCHFDGSYCVYTVYKVPVWHSQLTYIISDKDKLLNCPGSCWRRRKTSWDTAETLKKQKK